MDFAARELRRDGERVPLRSGEFATLKMFVKNEMIVLTRSQLNEKMRGQRRVSRPQSRCVDLASAAAARNRSVRAALCADRVGAGVYFRAAWGSDGGRARALRRICGVQDLRKSARS